MFVSDDTALSRNDYFPMLLADRKAAASHLELLSSLADVRGKRVLELEIRSRTGALLDQLRRLFGVIPYAMPIFESQKAIIEDVYGIPASEVIDFERFSIPFDGPFDVIVAKHMFTHALDPAAFFAALREKLVDGGHIYLYAEPDEAEAIGKRKTLFATMNPSHVPGFDRETLLRGLRRMGFEPTFVTHEGGGFACLARLNPAVEFKPISEPVLTKRVDAYARWREFNVLNLPKQARALYADEWNRIEREALSSGVAERDALGRVKARSPRPPAKKVASPARAPAARTAVRTAKAGLRGQFPAGLRNRLKLSRIRSTEKLDGAGDSLTELAARHGTNKALATKKRRPLTEVYEPYLAARRDEPLRIVEFGVEEGGSLRMWRDYFPRAEIIGVDIVRNKAQYADKRIQVLIGDQKEPTILDRIVAGGPLDLVIDDGSHRPRSSSSAFSTCGRTWRRAGSTSSRTSTPLTARSTTCAGASRARPWSCSRRSSTTSMGRRTNSPSRSPTSSTSTSTSRHAC